MKTIIEQRKRRLQDIDTGEYIEAEQITKISGKKSFWKIFLMDFLQILGGFEYKQLDVLIYILEHTNPTTNTYIGTYRATAERAGVSYNTTYRTIKLLQDKGMMTKVQNGLYHINPQIMLRGDKYQARLMLDYIADDTDT